MYALAQKTALRKRKADRSDATRNINNKEQEADVPPTVDSDCGGAVITAGKEVYGTDPAEGICLSKGTCATRN